MIGPVRRESSTAAALALGQAGSLGESALTSE
jgi:hypothetical protein